MYKTFFLLLTIFGLSTGLLAQATVGTVKNAETNELLVGAHIKLLPTQLSTISDSDGEFRFIHLKHGDYQVEVSFLGFEKQTVNVKIPLEGKLEIKMKRAAIIQDEIIVQATRIGESTPTAVSTVSEKEIESLNTGRDLPYLLQNTPSLVTSSDGGTGIGYTSLRIRGTDMSRINVMVNGIPLNDPESNQVYWVDLPDIATSAQEVQVQRGVATSVYGNSAFGAGLNLTTSSPSPDPFTEFSSTAGSFNTFRNYLKFGTGLMKNRISVEGRLSHITSDGYVDRASSKLKSYFLTGGYYGAKMLLKFNLFSGYERTYQAWNGVPSEMLLTNRTYNPSGEYTSVDGNTAYYDNEVDDYQQDHYQLFYSYLLSNHLHFNCALHYTHGRGYYENYKSDRKLLNYGFSDVIIGMDTIRKTDLIQRKYLDNDFLGGTMSLQFKASSRLEFQLGTAYNYYDGDHFGRVIWARVFPPTNTEPVWYESNGIKKEFNTFLKTQWIASKGLSIYTDLQFRSVNHNITGVNDDLRDLTQRHSYNFFNPKGGLSWQINPNHRIWLSVGVANREPSRSDFKDADPGKIPDSEMLMDYEAAYEFTSSLAKASANFFFMNYSNQLVLTGKINNTGDPIMVNVPHSFRFGLELSTDVKPAKFLAITAHTTLSVNKIKDYVGYVDNWDTYSQNEEILGTTDLSFSPSVTAGMQLYIQPCKNLVASWNARYVGKQYIDNTSNDNRTLAAYLVNDINMRYSIDNILFKKITLWIQVNNVFNELYETNAWIYRYIYNDTEYKYDGFFPQATRNFLAGVTIQI